MLYTTEEVSEYLRVSTRTVLRWIQNGDLEGIKVGRSYRISSKELADFIQGTKEDESE